MDHTIDQFLWTFEPLGIVSKISSILGLSSIITVHLIFIATPCYYGAYVATTKFKKHKVPSCHVVADKLLGEWSPRELGSSGTRNLED